MENNNECRCSAKGSTPYISAKELSERWQCARSSVDRVDRRAGIKRWYLGEGSHGMVRFIRQEDECDEVERLI